jgi:hypothetical protein
MRPYEHMLQPWHWNLLQNTYYFLQYKKFNSNLLIIVSLFADFLFIQSEAEEEIGTMRFSSLRCAKESLKYTRNNRTTNSAICSVKTLAIISMLCKKLCLIEREGWRCVKSRIPTAILTFQFVVGEVIPQFCLATVLFDSCCLPCSEPGLATLSVL